MKVKLNKNQQGYSILSVILVVVVMIVAISVWSLSGQTNLSNNSNGNIDVQATSLINDGLAYKSRFNQYQLEGATQTSIAYLPGGVTNTSTQFNLIDPNVGVPDKQVNTQLLNTSLSANEGYWVYLPYVATPLGKSISVNDYERIIAVGGIKDSVCKRINYIISGTEMIFNFGSGSSSLLSGITKSVPYKVSTIYMPPVPGPVMTPVGCGGNSSAPDHNLFYVIMQIN